MAFNGTLLTVGSYEITGRRYINWDSYNVTVNIQDLDSYRDANGVLQRNVLTNVPIKIEFETRENLTNTDLSTFFGAIRNNYTKSEERRANVTVYVPELDDYVTQYMYMADPQFKIKHIDGTTIYYEPVRVAFIGY